MRGPLVSVPLGCSTAPYDAHPRCPHKHTLESGPGCAEHHSCSRSLRQTEPIFLKAFF